MNEGFTDAGGMCTVCTMGIKEGRKEKKYREWGTKPGVIRESQMTRTFFGFFWRVETQENRKFLLGFTC
jgi:hypothetical protein